MNTGVGIRTVALPNPPLASPLEMPLKKLTTPTTNSETPSTKMPIVIARTMLKPPQDGYSREREEGILAAGTADGNAKQSRRKI